MRKAALSALALVPFAAFGCTAILGDFDVAAGGASSSSGGLGDGSNDGTGGDGASSDGGDQDVFDAASTVFSTCGVTAPRLVDETGDASVEFVGQLQIFRTGDNVRVITQRSQGQGAVVYTFNPQQNGSGSTGPIQNPTKLDLSNAGRYLDTRRLGGQNILALLFLYQHLDNPALSNMQVLELPDNDAMAFTAVPVSKDFASIVQNGSNTSGVLGAYPTNNEYFWALGDIPSFSAPGSFDLWVGHRTSAALPTPVTVRTTTDNRETRVRDMARAQGVQYIFNDKGPDGPNDKGTSFFVVPQDTTGTVEPKTLAPVGGTKPYVLLGVGGTPNSDGIRVATAEVDFNSTTSFGVVKAGTVPQADLAKGLDGTKVPDAFTLSSLTDVPAASSARFFGDELVWLGSPPDPLKGKGLNFIWFNTQTRVVRSKQTGMQRLLIDHTQIGESSIVLASQTAITADLDLVFTEKTTSGTSALLYARMTCIR